MSFLGGPECSTGANPLAQFQKQTSADTSLQRDRLTSRQSQQLNGFRSQSGLPHDAAFQDFAQQRPQFGDSLPTDPLHLEQLHQQQQQQQRGGSSGGAWAGEFSQQGPRFSPDEFAAQSRKAGFSPTDFANFRQSQWAAPSPTARVDSPAMQQYVAPRPQMFTSGFGGYGIHRPMGAFQSQFAGQPPLQQQQYEGKGKGRVQELSDTDWEKQFEALSTDDQQMDADIIDREAQDAIERELNDLDENMLADDALANHFGDGLDHWEGFDGQVPDFDAYRNNFDSHRPATGNYMFEESNPFTEIPNAYEEGQKIMREGGNLSLAALAFEAAVQKDSDFVDAWVALGQAQAQNEKEMPAIRALEKAMNLDPNNLEALMGLSVSYTNEGYDSLAYRSLERWVSVKYPQLGGGGRGLGSAETEIGFTDREMLHERVSDLFLQAAQLNPEGGDIDVDVQVGLGVLFYGSEEYDKAVDCFNAALNSVEHGALKREGEEHLLWNRLGATLANSGRSDEAIEAYQRALELRPNFVRARYNLGVSCINLGVQEQAAAHLLGALQMHRVQEAAGRQKAAELLRDGSGHDVVDDADVEGLLRQNESTNIYDTLRRVFGQMDRRDLSEMVGPDMDLDSFRREFDFDSS